MLSNLADSITSGGQQPINTTTTDISIDPAVLIAIIGIVMLIVVIVIVVAFHKSSSNQETGKQDSTVQMDSIDDLSQEERELLRKHRNEFSNLTEDEKELIRKHREQSDKQ